MRVPLPYLLGKCPVSPGTEFLVEPGVVVPRSPLGAADRRHASRRGCAELSRSAVLDLCTGTGCIGIACALAFSRRGRCAHRTSIPLRLRSPRATSVNARRRLSGLPRSWSDVLRGHRRTVRPDRVSNPPYVDAADMAALPPEYRAEPEASGSRVGPTDWIVVARRIVDGAVAISISPSGLLVCEVGNSAALL